MKYISLFSGIEAATVAWQTLGWEPVAYAEIEPFPKAVLKHHYPNVPDLGDMTKVNWKEYHHAADVVLACGEVSPTLSTDHNPAVYQIERKRVMCRADTQANAAQGFDLSPTLMAHAGKDAPFIYPTTNRRD